jgi:hypothetical protein
MTENSNQFAREAWNANAEIWDARMGDEGNDFFNTMYTPLLVNGMRYTRL